MRRTKKTIICSMLTVALTVLCAVSFTACNDSHDSRYVSSDATYSLYNNYTSVFGFGLETVGAMLSSVGGFSKDEIEATVKLTDSGKINMKLHIKNGAKLNDLIHNKLPELLASLPGGGADFDIDKIIASLDLNSFIDTYVSALFPGVTLDDLKGSLELMKKAVGVSFIGIDWNRDSTKHLADTVKDTGKLPPLKEIVFSDNGFGVEFNGQYELRDLKDADGNKYKAVCIGLQDIQDDPFLMLTMERDKVLDKDILTGQVKFVKFNMYAVRL